jgi:hypothetical protein
LHHAPTFTTLCLLVHGENSRRVSSFLVDAWYREDNIFSAHRQYIVFPQAFLLCARYDHNTRNHGLYRMIEFVSLPVLSVVEQEQGSHPPKASPLVYPLIVDRR